MFSKIKSLIWHHETHKKYLLYALAFLVGMVFSYGIFNIPVGNYKGFMIMEEEIEMHNAGRGFRGMEEEIVVTANCKKNNCDVLNKLNNLEKQLSDTSSALGKGITYNGNSVTAHLLQQIKGYNGQFGFSSWTLEALAQNTYQLNDRNKLNGIHNKIGNSSWTLEALAKHVDFQNQINRSLIHKKCKK